MPQRNIFHHLANSKKHLQTSTNTRGHLPASTKKDTSWMTHCAKPDLQQAISTNILWPNASDRSTRDLANAEWLQASLHGATYYFLPKKRAKASNWTMQRTVKKIRRKCEIAKAKKWKGIGQSIYVYIHIYIYSQWYLVPLCSVTLLQSSMQGSQGPWQQLFCCRSKSLSARQARCAVRVCLLPVGTGIIKRLCPWAPWVWFAAEKGIPSSFRMYFMYWTNALR